jgi:putative tryptophan/tyrosine transport system substrate-binding protein
LSALAGAALLPRQAFAQRAKKVHRLGMLFNTSRGFLVNARITQVLEQTLRELGYIEGSNLTIERRYAEGREDRLAVLASEIAALNVDVILAGNDLTALAAKNATATIPIVFAAAGDPVGIGLVKSLARPGGNVTGFASFSETTIAKQLELLTEAFPGTRHIAVIHSSRAAASAMQLAALREASARLNLRVVLHDLSAGGGIEQVFRLIDEQPPQALQVLVSIPALLERARLAEFAAARSLPAVYGLSEHVEAGGLMSYSFSLVDNFRRAAGYIDKILKGATPADLPVEQPSKFELSLNLKAARALGRPFPTAILLRADRVIES